jgi:hypothetical protein
VTAKFDAKRARENMWVTHQNLARAKGGRPLYAPKHRNVPAVNKPAPRAPVNVSAPAPAPVPESTDPPADKT